VLMNGPLLSRKFLKAVAKMFISNSHHIPTRNSHLWPILWHISGTGKLFASRVNIQNFISDTHIRASFR
jgi:hypothetical protein